MTFVIHLISTEKYAYYILIVVALHGTSLSPVSDEFLIETVVSIQQTFFQFIIGNIVFLAYSRPVIVLDSAYFCYYNIF